MTTAIEPTVLMKTRPSILHYLPYFLFPFLVFTLGRFVASTLLIFWILELLILFKIILRIFLKEYLITNKTFSVEYFYPPVGKKVSVALEEIKGIEIQPRLFFQRWFNTANILIETDRPDGLEFVLSGVENPEGFKNFIYSLRKI